MEKTEETEFSHGGSGEELGQREFNTEITGITEETGPMILGSRVLRISPFAPVKTPFPLSPPFPL